MDALKGFKTIAGLAFFMVALQLLNVATGYSLMAFGLIPRTLQGLPGILTVFARVVCPPERQPGCPFDPGHPGDHRRAQSVRYRQRDHYPAGRFTALVVRFCGHTRGGQRLGLRVMGLPPLLYT